jgi:hypothetical protein
MASRLAENDSRPLPAPIVQAGWVRGQALRGRESFSTSDLPLGESVPRKRLPTPSALAAKLTRSRRMRRGQSLVEFALVALVVYLLLAAILTFGHALYVAQGLQQAADLAAREIARTPLPADITLDNPPGHPDGEGALHHDRVRSQIFDEAYLVIDLDAFFAGGGENFFHDDDGLKSMPLLNQQLATLMIVDDRSVPDTTLLRYPGALLERTTPVSPPNGVTYRDWVATKYTVGVPLIVDRGGAHGEQVNIRWIPIVEEIEPADPDDPRHNPFQISSELRGIVALRINYPFQSASMSSFRAERGPFEPTVAFPNVADDDAVVDPDGPPGALVGGDLVDDQGLYATPYGGRYGLGAQGALGSQQLTGGRSVRPYRRVISAQAIYRREVFGAPEENP